jgi:SAM-dependent methyltransferase
MLNRFKRFITSPKKFLKNLCLQILWNLEIPIKHQLTGAIHVDLGSGNQPRNPFGASNLIGTDFHSGFTTDSGVQFVKCDLTKPLPFNDNSIDSMSAFDVLEHIPRWERTPDSIQFPFINLMNEISRCLKPGGFFVAVTPSYPSDQAFQDPTHVNFISPVTIRYFVGPKPMANQLGYGFNGDFELVCQTWVLSDSIFRGSYFTKITQPKFSSYFFQPSTFFLILKLWFRYTFGKPSHLLWVMRKPL